MNTPARIQAFFDEPTHTVSYLVSDPATRQAAIGEHIRDVQSIFRPVFNIDDVGSEFDRLPAGGDTLAIGGLAVQVMRTPGHTPACVSYLNIPAQWAAPAGGDAA